MEPIKNNDPSKPEPKHQREELTLKLNLPNVIAAPPTFISELNCEAEGICKREDWLDVSRRAGVTTRHLKRGLNLARRAEVEEKIGVGDPLPNKRASAPSEAAPSAKPRKTAAEYLDEVPKAGSR